MGTLRQEIDTILNDDTLDYDSKAVKLARLVTKQELAALLPKPTEQVRLKEPLSPKTKGMKTLSLSIYSVYFDEIARGTKKEEYRDYNDYYIQKCTYVEDGKRYIVPFDALVFYVGRGKSARSMTVALTDITCEGGFFVFHLGKILYPQN